MSTILSILLEKRNFDLYLHENIRIDKENIKAASNVKMLGVHTDNKLKVYLLTKLIKIFTNLLQDCLLPNLV